MITVRKLIDANRIAFREGTLGAFKHKHCRYTYEDGCHCAIGTVLSRTEIANLHDLDLNGAPLGMLIHNGLKVDHPAIFGLVQALHDAWASGGHLFGEGNEEDGSDYAEFPEIAAFVAEVSGRKVGAVEFATLLDVLDHVFTPTVEVSSFHLGEVA